ncbi:dhhc zinc finger domain-containing protein [Cyclospora cayetanensis]|uniref:Dhhc zinc finger domain-containing protein n=1 Tax=Cyclospora cayetanensis TaxID=88456 RepID=A0A1D3CWC8_9EIME|nr:dhhc zinc finger domain-containing protein [Cyclospora cayetanensis]
MLTPNLLSDSSSRRLRGMRCFPDDTGEPENARQQGAVGKEGEKRTAVASTASRFLPLVPQMPDAERLFRVLLRRRGFCGPAAKQKVAGWGAYIFLQNNPFGQILYMALMVGAYTEYLRRSRFYPMLSLVPAIRVVTPQNARLFCQAFPCDGLLYAEGASCRHAASTAACATIVFCALITTAFGSAIAYGAFVGASLLLFIVKEKKLFSVMLIDIETGERHRPTLTLVFRYLLGTWTELVLLFSLCVMVGIALCFFLSMHLSLLLRNKTTNEVVKYRRMLKLARALPHKPKHIDPEDEDLPVEAADATASSCAEVKVAAKGLVAAATHEDGTHRLSTPANQKPSESLRGNSRGCNSAGRQALRDACEVALLGNQTEPPRPFILTKRPEQPEIAFTRMRNRCVHKNVQGTLRLQSHADRLRRYIFLEDALHAITASRRFYDRGLTENCREVICFELFAKEHCIPLSASRQAMHRGAATGAAAPAGDYHRLLFISAQ